MQGICQNIFLANRLQVNLTVFGRLVQIRLSGSAGSQPQPMLWNNLLVTHGMHVVALYLIHCLYTYTHVQIHIYTCTNTHIHKYKYTYRHVQILIYKYTFTRVQKHIYIYTKSVSDAWNACRCTPHCVIHCISVKLNSEVFQSLNFKLL